MKTVITKSFHFSASHAKDGRVIGKNYILEIAIEAVEPDQEELFEKKVREKVIRPVESADLGLHVNFLAGIEVNDLNLMKVFWAELKKICPDFKPQSLTLFRDSGTRTTLSA